MTKFSLAALPSTTSVVDEIGSYTGLTVDEADALAAVPVPILVKILNTLADLTDEARTLSEYARIEDY